MTLTLTIRGSAPTEEETDGLKTRLRKPFKAAAYRAKKTCAKVDSYMKKTLHVPTQIIEEKKLT
jgi:hypothetical protein